LKSKEGVLNEIAMERLECLERDSYRKHVSVLNETAIERRSKGGRKEVERRSKGGECLEVDSYGK